MSQRTRPSRVFLAQEVSNETLQTCWHCECGSDAVLLPKCMYRCWYIIMLHQTINSMRFE